MCFDIGQSKDDFEKERLEMLANKKKLEELGSSKTSNAEDINKESYNLKMFFLYF
jgi:hypothetical protein